MIPLTKERDLVLFPFLLIDTEHSIRNYLYKQTLNYCRKRNRKCNSTFSAASGPEKKTMKRGLLKNIKKF
jgi:hypothetical protein